METIKLHNGELVFTAQYHDAEMSSAPLVLCLHGFPDNANSFRYQIDDLVAAGYRVLVPTMRGYEPSSIPADGDFTLASIAGDIIAWLDELEVEQVHLVGHDWGSATSYVAADLAPSRFLSLTTIAVPHPARFSREGMQKVPVQALKSWYMLFNQIPGVSDYFVKRNDFSFIRFLWRKWSPGQVLTVSEWDDLRQTFGQPGVVKAMLGYYRQNVSLPQLLGLKQSASSSLTKIPVANLAISGADDGCIDTRVFDHAILPEDHPMGVQFERIKDAGHFTHQEQPAVVNKLLIDWFQKHDTTMQK
ncbi:MAG: alpha/beta hydrolase [Proteobacteria bacterium]|nr:alpha/beta hydrolase [Pseudomonadota bacterium]